MSDNQPASATGFEPNRILVCRRDVLVVPGTRLAPASHPDHPGPHVRGLPAPRHWSSAPGHGLPEHAWRAARQANLAGGAGANVWGRSGQHEAQVNCESCFRTDGAVREISYGTAQLEQLFPQPAPRTLLPSQILYTAGPPASIPWGLTGLTALNCSSTVSQR